MAKTLRGLEPPRRSFVSDIVGDSPGAFYNGNRVTTPSGFLVAPHRPVSQLAARWRGVSPGACEDDRRASTPEVVSCGSLALWRASVASRGERLCAPNDAGRDRPLATRVDTVVTTPNLEALQRYLAEVVESVRLAPGGGGPALARDLLARGPGFSPAMVSALFSDSAPALHVAWQRQHLSDRSSLLYAPVCCVGINNTTQQSQLARAATLLHALLKVKEKVEKAEFIPVVRRKRLAHVEPLERLFSFTREQPRASSSSSATDVGGSGSGSFAPDSAAVGDAVFAAFLDGPEGDDRLVYHEGARHVIVCHGSQAWEVAVCDPDGRTLESSELHQRLMAVASSADAGPPSAVPFGQLSSLPRRDFARVRRALGDACLSNRLCLEALDSALMVVRLEPSPLPQHQQVRSEKGGMERTETPASDAPSPLMGFVDSPARGGGSSGGGSSGSSFGPPTLGLPSTEHAAWLGKALTLDVLASGSAVLRASALAIDTPLLSAVAAWAASGANCDPMLAYARPASVTVQAVRRAVRTPTPVSGKRPLKPVRAGAPAEDEVVAAPQAIALPPAPQAAEPRLLSLWMPAAFGRTEPAFPPSPPPPFSVRSFGVALRDECVLHLACVLAVRHVTATRVDGTDAAAAGVDAGVVPIVHAVSQRASRDPTIRLCLTGDVESAVRHVAQYTRFGPLRTEVDRACTRAVASLRAALADDAPPHVSDFCALAAHRLAVPNGARARRAATAAVFCRPALAVTRVDCDAALPWCFQTPVAPAGEGGEAPAPLLSYHPLPSRGASSLHPRGAVEYLCTLVSPPAAVGVEGSARPLADAARLCQAIQLFAGFVTECLDNCRDRERGHAARKPLPL